MQIPIELVILFLSGFAYLIWIVVRQPNKKLAEIAKIVQDFPQNLTDKFEVIKADIELRTDTFTRRIAALESDHIKCSSDKSQANNAKISEMDKAIYDNTSEIAELKRQNTELNDKMDELLNELGQLKELVSISVSNASTLQSKLNESQATIEMFIKLMEKKAAPIQAQTAIEKKKPLTKKG